MLNVSKHRRMTSNRPPEQVNKIFITTQILVIQCFDEGKIVKKSNEFHRLNHNISTRREKNFRIWDKWNYGVCGRGVSDDATDSWWMTTIARRVERALTFDWFTLEEVVSGPWKRSISSISSPASHAIALPIDRQPWWHLLHLLVRPRVFLPLPILSPSQIAAGTTYYYHFFSLIFISQTLSCRS